MSIAAAIAKQLQEAQGDRGKLVLVTLDLVLGGEEPWLREAIGAAAIPHWFTPAILGRLLGVDDAIASRLAMKLQELPMVERFAARGAWNVHETTRLALRDRMAREDPERFSMLSGRAARCFEGDPPHLRIETIFHRLIVAPQKAESEDLRGLYSEWHRAGRREPLQALGICLRELLQHREFVPIVRANLLLCYGLVNRDRLPRNEIEKLVRQSLEIFDNLHEYDGQINALDLLGDTLFDQRRWAEAQKEYETLQQIASTLAQTAPENATWQQLISVSHNKVGRVYEAEDRFAQALHEHEIAKRIMEKITRQNPDNSDWQHELAGSHIHVGAAYRGDKRWDDALMEYKASKQIMSRLIQRDPGNAGWQSRLATAYSGLGAIYQAQGRRDDAQREYQAAKQVMMTLVEQDPGNTSWQRELATFHYRLGQLLAVQGLRKEALAEYARSLRIAEELVEFDPENPKWQDDLRVSQQAVINLQEHG